MLMSRDVDRRATARLCRDRAAGYGALRKSSLTAIALDRAAELLEVEPLTSDAASDIERERQRAVVSHNAQLVLGVIAGLLMKDSAEVGSELHCSPVEVEPRAGTMIVQTASENTFRISVVQIGGTE